MKRNVKAHEDRRNDILDAAWELFTNKGYESTPIAAIIEKLKISKGGFYHYFSSKESVLNALADRLSEEALTKLRPIVEDSELEAEKKLNRFMETARESRLQRIDSVVTVTKVLWRDENLIIRHKINQRFAEITVPLLQTIIEQGIKEGAFEVSSIQNDSSAAAQEAALFFWILATAFAEEQTKTLLSSESLERKVKILDGRAEFASQSLERMLGAKSGLIRRPDAMMLKLFALAFEEEGDSASEI